MKRAIWRSLPQVIIVFVIVAVGASIVLKELGVSFAKKSAAVDRKAPSQSGIAAPPAANPAANPAAVNAGQGSVTGGSASGAATPAGAPATPGAATQGSSRTIVVRAATISAGSISNYTKINGDVISGNQTKIYPAVGGKLLERKVPVGAWVAKGEIIALVDPSKVGESYLPNPVESTVAGTILSIPVSEGDTISTNTVIATVGNLSDRKISTSVPERFLANLKIGTPAEVSFDAIPNAAYRAKISELSPVVDTSTRTLDVKLSLDTSDSRILVGMFATVKLETENKRNVLVIPRSAVILTSTDASAFVIKPDGTVERRAIALGTEGEDAFEVKSGLSAGEKVVTEGKSSLSNGDRVRVIDGKGGTQAGAAQ